MTLEDLLNKQQEFNDETNYTLTLIVDRMRDMAKLVGEQHNEIQLLKMEVDQLQKTTIKVN